MLFKKNTEYEILTPTGWSDFKGISKIIKDKYIKILFSNGNKLECSENHRIKSFDGKFKYAKDLIVGDEILSKEGNIFILDIQIIDVDVDLYDVINVNKDFEFYSNDVISHNCAFIDDIENIWGSAQQTLANGGKAIILSCVTEDTFIFTDKGLKQIKNFVPEDGNVGDYKIEKYNILGVDNIREGTYFKNAGNHDIIKLVTKFGALEGSKIHKLWAYKKSENKYDWYKLEELNIGDYISIQYGMNIFGNNDDISNFNPSKSNKIKKIIHPKLLTKEFAYLFGLYIAEGSSYKVMSRNNFLVGGNISITCGDNDIVWVFDALGLDYYCHPDGLHHN
jgi:hypothetical protein